MLIPVLDEFLTSFGFVRMAVFMATEVWGDALYIQKALVNPVEKIPPATAPTVDTTATTTPFDMPSVDKPLIESPSSLTSLTTSITTTLTTSLTSWTQAWTPASWDINIDMDLGYILGLGPRGATSSGNPGVDLGYILGLSPRGATSGISGSPGGMSDTVAVLLGSAVLLLHVCGWLCTKFPRTRARTRARGTRDDT